MKKTIPKQPQKSRVIGYIRVSTSKQDTESQRLAILNYAHKQKIKVDEFIEITISSGKTPKDRRITELIGKLKPYDTLIVAELSRLGRSVGQVVTMIDGLIKSHVHVIVLKQNLDLLPNGQKDMNTTIAITVYSMLAEIERDLISMRTKEALAARKAQGVTLGRPKGIGKSKLDPHREEIIERLKIGVPQTRIAKQYGIGAVGLSLWLKKHGIKGKMK